eukprot:72519_1
MADTESKEVENNGSNVNTKDSSSVQPNKASTGKKLSANAPVFDVSRSPTLDPYAGPNGIRTQPCYVPPATIPPPATQQPSQQPQQQTQQQTQQQQQHQHQQSPQQHHHHHTSHHTQQPQTQRSKQRQRGPQPQYPGIYDGHMEADRRNQIYQKYPNPNAVYPKHPHAQHQYQQIGHQKYPSYAYPTHYRGNNTNTTSDNTSSKSKDKQQDDKTDNKNDHNNNNNNNNNGSITNKVQFKTFTNQKNARAVGSTIEYK